MHVVVEVSCNVIAKSVGTRKSGGKTLFAAKPTPRSLQKVRPLANSPCAAAVAAAAVADSVCARTAAVVAPVAATVAAAVAWPPALKRSDAARRRARRAPCPKNSWHNNWRQIVFRFRARLQLRLGCDPKISAAERKSALLARKFERQRCLQLDDLRATCKQNFALCEFCTASTRLVASTGGFDRAERSIWCHLGRAHRSPAALIVIERPPPQATPPCTRARARAAAAVGRRRATKPADKQWRAEIVGHCCRAKSGAK